MHRKAPFRKNKFVLPQPFLLEPPEQIRRHLMTSWGLWHQEGFHLHDDAPSSKQRRLVSRVSLPATSRRTGAWAASGCSFSAVFLPNGRRSVITDLTRSGASTAQGFIFQKRSTSRSDSTPYSHRARPRSHRARPGPRWTPRKSLHLPPGHHRFRVTYGHACDLTRAAGLCR